MRWFAGLFDRLEPSTSAALAAGRRSSHFSPGQDILRMGEVPDSLHVVRHGSVKVWRLSRTGNAMTLYYMASGAPIGLLAVMHAAEMTITVTAATAVETWHWPAALARRLIHADARFAANGMRIVGGALAQVAERLEDATGATAEQQVARALLRLAGDQIGRDETPVTIAVSRQDLADLTGTTLYTASRTLSDWARQGLVESGRGRVVLKDVRALAGLAGV